MNRRSAITEVPGLAPGANPSRVCPGCRGAAYSPPVTSLMFRRGRVICANCRLTDLECPCEFQPTLFEQTRPIDPESIEGRFRKFHSLHPEVYTGLARLARQARTAGHQRIGIGMLWEVLRWNYAVGNDPTSDDFKLNDHYRSRYARLLMDREDDLEGFFETRALTTE